LVVIGAEMLLIVSHHKHSKIKFDWCHPSCKWIHPLLSWQLCYWVSWWYSLISVHWLKGLFLRRLWRQCFTNVHSARKSLKILPLERSQCHGILHSREKDKEERLIKFSF